MSAGIGIDQTCSRSLAALRTEADDILRTLDSPSAPRVATLSDVRTRVLLRYAGVELSRNPELWNPALGTLDAGRTDGVSLGASLLAWFEALFDIRKAADTLFVHPNTLRYRLRRITELTGLDLDDADECLGLWLQLRVQLDMNATDILRCPARRALRPAQSSIAEASPIRVETV
jgi:DNA-binding PucR family transcriptional regulator